MFQTMSHLRYFSLVLVALCLARVSVGLENGLARTPPMGWLAWERFRCNIDCANDPDNCISETLFMQMADIMKSQGYLDAGYNIVSLDDCWLAKDRDAEGKLQPDADRFPSGLTALADYMHTRGIKFGIYEDYGNHTCGGYPGILGHLETDAQTFADWGVDYVKLDGCYANPADMDKGYPAFGHYLNITGRPMTYSCSWPVYQIESGIQPNWTSIIGTCNLWRNYGDIQDSWQSVESIIDYYGNNQDDIVPNAGPGHWNDPDMLIIGNYGLSYEQSKSQMALWAIFAAPLIMSNDLRDIKPDYKAILINKNVIAVNQDSLGIQGRRVYKENGIEKWLRPITPVDQDFYSYAIAFLNRLTNGRPAQVTTKLSDIGLTYAGGYNVTDLFSNVNYGIMKPDESLTVDVNPTGVVLVRANLVPGLVN